MSEKVDVSKLREGDVVTLKAEVEADDYLRISLGFGHWSHFPISQFAHAIVSVEPRPLKVGDRVRSICGTGSPMTLLAIDGPFGWVSDERGRYTYDLPRLERV